MPVTEMHRYIAAKRGFEYVVQECCVPRSDVFVQAVGGTSSVLRAPRPRPRRSRRNMRKLEGLRVSVDFYGEDSERIAEPLKGGGREGRSDEVS